MMQFGMIRRALPVLSGLALVLTTTACQTPRPLPIGKPPAERLQCENEPARPEGRGAEYVDGEGRTRREVTDEENGEYLRDLRAAWFSCFNAVGWLRVFHETR